MNKEEPFFSSLKRKLRDVLEWAALIFACTSVVGFIVWITTLSNKTDALADDVHKLESVRPVIYSINEKVSKNTGKLDTIIEFMTKENNDD